MNLDTPLKGVSNYNYLVSVLLIKAWPRVWNYFKQCWCYFWSIDVCFVYNYRKMSFDYIGIINKYMKTWITRTYGPKPSSGGCLKMDVVTNICLHLCLPFLLPNLSAVGYLLPTAECFAPQNMMRLSQHLRRGRPRRRRPSSGVQWVTIFIHLSACIRCNQSRPKKDSDSSLTDRSEKTGDKISWKTIRAVCLTIGQHWLKIV